MVGASCYPQCVYRTPNPREWRCSGGTECKELPAMTDRDPYGRRRIPDDRDYQNPDWEDEGAAPDPYDYQPPQDPRRAMPPAGRQPAGADDPFLPANDPYASSSYRQPQPPPYDAPERGEWSEQPAWPDRPYAPGGSQRQPQPAPDPYAPQRRQQRPPAYDYEEYPEADDIAQWEEEQRRGPRRPQRPPRDGYPEDIRRRPAVAVPSGLSNAIAGQDSRLLLIVLGSILSLLAMIAVTALRTDSVGWFPLHINAAGETTEWGSETALWRLPFTVGIITIMNLMAGFILGLRDRKLTWLMVVSLPALHLLAWIALILIAW